MNQRDFSLGLLAMLIAASPVLAQNEKVERPRFEAGDTWTYRQTIETKAGFKEERDTYTLTRSTPTTLYLDVHQDGSAQPPRSIYLGADWSRMRSVNGVETVVAQPVNYPLTPGKSWTLHYREDHPNVRHAWEDWTSTFTVVGHETVQVGAGRFDAIKIEAEGRWVAEVLGTSTVAAAAVGASGNASIDSKVSTTATHQGEGRTYKAVWYVPGVKRWVKSVEEYYGSGGERTERYVSELENYSVH